MRRLLEEQGHQASGICSRTRTGPGGLIACDLLDYGSLADRLGKAQPELVFHLAAQTSPALSWQQPRQFFESNVQGTVHLLEAVRTRCPQARVLLVSSSQVYAPPSPKQRLKEDSPLDSPNPYACSKRLAELAALQYWSGFGVRLIIARPFNHSGPGQSDSFVVPDFCRQAALLERKAGPPGESVIRVGNLEPIRDFLDVRDVVRAYLLLALKGEEGQAYNVCSGKGTSIRAILEAVLSEARIAIEVRSESKRQRKHDQPALVGDNGKLRQIGSWAPQVSLREMIRDTLEHWRREEATETHRD